MSNRIKALFLNKKQKKIAKQIRVVFSKKF